MTLQDIDLGDTIELLVATVLLVGYGYLVFAEGYRIEDPFLESMLVMAALSIFGDNARIVLRGDSESAVTD